MDDTTLARIADEAYVMGLRATNDRDRNYAHGVEDLARLLAGEAPESGMVRILLAAGLRGMVTA